MSKLIQITTPLREFKGHEGNVMAVAVLPNKREMITSSYDKTLRLWDLKTRVMLKKMEGHSVGVVGLAVSQDGQLIASGDLNGEVAIWRGKTGESLTQPIKFHSNCIASLDFSPDGAVLATGSHDRMTKLWNTKTWEQQGSIECGSYVYCVRYSPGGDRLAIATFDNIKIYNTSTRYLRSFKAHSTSFNCSLAWTPDGTRLLTGGGNSDPTIREWDALTWKEVGGPWAGHIFRINAITVNPTGTFVASVSSDNCVHVWRLSNRQTVAIFDHASLALCGTFSVDGKHILSGGGNEIISEWAVPNDLDISSNTDANNHTYRDYSHRSKILAITTAHDACIDGDLSTAEDLLTRDINTNANNYTSYVHRSFVLARKYNWDQALQDAMKSISIQPSLIGYISKGIALCGTGHIQGARVAFDVASMYTDQDSRTIHFLLLIKAIALFNADQRDEASLLLKELTVSCPYADTRACHIVQAYLCVQLGTQALDSGRYSESTDHFTAAINSGAFSSKSDIYQVYEDLVILFGWNLKSVWLTTHQKCCHAFLRAGKFQDAVKLYRYMMVSSDGNTRSDCLDWFNAFTVECSSLCLTNGDAALAASDYDRAIDLYSTAISLASTSVIFFVNRSKAKLGKTLWEDALLDAQTVTELDPASHVGYQLMHTALRGAQRYDEATFKTMLSKLDNSPEAQIRDLSRQYLSISEAEDVEFNSCLPADITSYTTPPRTLPSLSENEIQTTICSLRKNPAVVDLASKLYYRLDNASVARFVNYSCSLHLPCITFRVTDVSLSHDPTQETRYGIKADGLHDLQIITKEPIVQFSRTIPNQQTFVLVRPWNRSLLELPDFADVRGDKENERDYWTPPSSPLDESTSCSLVQQEVIVVDLESRALRLLVRLGQPFRAFLLERRCGAEYKRIASDHDITAQVKDVTSVLDLMDIRTIEIMS
ncbi:WD40-repeat-containing domain protein [Suillus bovinus]|uniref:WD40-repeat-containing domain protein n=1 Tax=Suillus bovinus TaxID=48563 RepID=UPI001B8832A6|nr:WD40-repeat-containing domain protein [Suillus bovinus]KAG2150247.1 WD40-repeat-containing domain protein [Suillus bovinus]